MTLGWFTSFTGVEWDGPFSDADESPFTGRFHMDMAKTLERAGFDFILLEDTLMVPHTLEQSFNPYLRLGSMAPKHDPLPLAAMMAAATERIGIVATMSTMFYPPFMAARLVATLDHLTGSRFGWNVVTSAEDSAAQNFGLDVLPEHDLRYDMADEYLDLVQQLWGSWDQDAYVRDYATSTYVSPDSVRPVNFEGKFFKSRGPLNTLPPRGGRPVIAQAGGSPRGRAFAAKYADIVMTIAKGTDKMRRYRDDVRETAAACGRNPDDLKVVYVVNPIMAETSAAAHEKSERIRTSDRRVQETLLLVSSITEIDFSQYELDEPLPELTTNGERTALEAFAQPGSGKTLRELAQDGIANSMDLVGTPDEVADQMEAIMTEVGGDGFMITVGQFPLNRRYILEVAEGLVPALRRRGLVRREYSSPYFRENLLDR